MNLPKKNIPFFRMVLIGTIVSYFEIQGLLFGGGPSEGSLVGTVEHQRDSFPFKNSNEAQKSLLSQKARRSFDETSHEEYSDNESFLEGSVHLPIQGSQKPDFPSSISLNSSFIPPPPKSPSASPRSSSSFVVLYPQRLSSSQLFTSAVCRKDFSFLMEAEKEIESSRKRLLENLFEIQKDLDQQKNIEKEEDPRLLQAFFKKKQEPCWIDDTNVPKLLSPILPIRKNFEKADLAQIQSKCTHQQFVAQIAARIASYEIEFDLLGSYLPRRNALFSQQDVSSSSNSRDVNSQSVPQTAVSDGLIRTQEFGRKIIENFFNQDNTDLNSIYNSLNQLDDEKLCLIGQVINVVRKTQLLILGCHAPHYITMNKEELADVEEELKAKILKLTPVETTLDQIGLEIQKRYREAERVLEKSKSDFLFMEATSTAEETSIAAEENARVIAQLVQTIGTTITTLQEDLRETETNDQTSVNRSIKTMEELRDLLLKSMLSYRAISDEASIEKNYTTLNDLKKEIFTEVTSLSSKNSEPIAKLIYSETGSVAEFFNSILSHSAFHIPGLDSSPATPSKFLESLTTLDENILTKKIIGTNGKIALDSPINLNGYTPKMRREFFAAFKLIELAICREYGLEASTSFAQIYFLKPIESIPLTGQQVKNFLFDKTNNLPNYVSSFFIDPKMKHTDFLAMLLNSSSQMMKDRNTFLQKVIKIDQATLSFNPFEKNSSDFSKSITSDLEQREKATRYVREAVKEAFPEASLLKEEMEQILLKFDRQFDPSSGSLFRLEEACAFIQTEKELLNARTWWEKNVARYVNKEAVTNIRNGIFFNIGSHLGTAVILFLSYLYYLSWTHTT